MDTAPWRRLPLLLLCGLLAVIGLIESQVHLELTGPAWDAHAYLGAWDAPMYDGSVGTMDQYLYSPAFAHLVLPLTPLGWPAFGYVFVVANAIGLAWLLRPLRATVAVPLWLAGSQEILSGNVFIPMAVATVLGMARPQLWAFAALTKITPCLGPVWFAARREWRPLGLALGATAAVAIVSGTAAPHLWSEWARFLVEQLQQSHRSAGYSFIPGPIVRLPVALVVVVFAARTGRVWLLPVAMVVATPFIWNGSFTLLAAIPRLRGDASNATPRDRVDGPPVQPPSSTRAPTARTARRRR